MRGNKIGHKVLGTLFGYFLVAMGRRKAGLGIGSGISGFSTSEWELGCSFTRGGIVTSVLELGLDSWTCFAAVPDCTLLEYYFHC